MKTADKGVHLAVIGYVVTDGKPSLLGKKRSIFGEILLPRQVIQAKEMPRDLSTHIMRWDMAHGIHGAFEPSAPDIPIWGSFGFEIQCCQYSVSPCGQA